MGKKRKRANSGQSGRTASVEPVTATSINGDRDEDDELDLLDYNYSIPGSLPGTLNIPDDAEPTELVLMSFTAADVVRKTLLSPAECQPYLGPGRVCWLDVRGLGTESRLREVGSIFNLHPLLLEDVVNVPQRPKLEFYDEHLLMIVHMLKPAPVGEVLCRFCRNLARQYHRAGEPANAARHADFVRQFEQAYRRNARS